METRTISCMAVEKGGKFLCIRRASDDSYSGIWEFPSGTLEEGETLEQCARRELLEESGLTAGDLKHIGKGSRRLLGGDVTIVQYFYTDKFSGKVRLSDEHSDFKWFTKGQILNMEKLSEDAKPDVDATGKIGMDAYNFFNVNKS